jgi:hypothetical protein
LLDAGSKSQTLRDAAILYAGMGYSVLPLLGDADPARPKAPTVEWGVYQRRRAAAGELARWFEEERAGALGIVCGHLSGLVVLDFDDEALYEQFALQHPALLTTRTVGTRRGRHLYYAARGVGSRKGRGIDLLSDGRYVVAPPSAIDGHAYTILRGGRPLPLTAAQIEQLVAFVGNALPEPVVFPVGSQTTTSLQHTPMASSQHTAPLQPPPVPVAATICPPTRTAVDLITFYRALASRGGRNNALFTVACAARDAGWTAHDTIATLTDVHARQATLSAHRSEKMAGRARSNVPRVQWERVGRTSFTTRFGSASWPTICRAWCASSRRCASKASRRA